MPYAVLLAHPDAIAALDVGTADLLALEYLLQEPHSHGSRDYIIDAQRTQRELSPQALRLCGADVWAVQLFISWF
ncbi:MAG: hypothetical protein MI924_05940 [Chloroflexales bacterium]|nr:hypothetical protein [Chloroflexales bacterium]